MLIAAKTAVEQGTAHDRFRIAARRSEVPLRDLRGDNPPWKPVRVFDDGKKVYIQFPDHIDRGEAPPLFVVGQDGQSELVNYRMRGNFYVVDRLFSTAELRLGQDPQQVVRITRADGSSRKGGLAGLFGG